MKNVLSLLIILAVGSVATAGTATLEILNPQESYLPSDIVVIGIMGTDATQVKVGSITTDSGGTAQGPWAVNAGFDWAMFLAPGTVVNDGTTLITGMNGNINFGSPPVEGVLASFEFHVPELQESSIIIIDDFLDAAGGISTSVLFSDNTSVTDLNPVEIHVIPEPMTIGLLGLGALGLLRRRRTA